MPSPAAPGRMAVISDMPLQATRPYRERYERATPRHGVHGVFETADGAVVRHHGDDRISAWLAGFEPVARRETVVATMNGTPARAIQRLVAKQDRSSAWPQP